MAIEMTLAETASGFYSMDKDHKFNVIGMSARHYIIVRHRDGVAVHVTGDDAEKLAVMHTRLQGMIRDQIIDLDRMGAMFASLLDTMCIQPALEEIGFIGVGKIDCGNRPVGHN